MSEIRPVTTLKTKRDEILFSIRLYEERIKQARADLAHVNAAIKIFEASGDPKEMGRYVDTHRLMRRGEPIALCKEGRAWREGRDGELDQVEAQAGDIRCYFPSSHFGRA